jgi:hypothetical protein
MSDDLVKQALAELQDLVRCRCAPAYKDRKLRDPDCHCEDAGTVKVVAERIETLEHTLDRVAAVLRLSLKYNTAMHGGAAAHNQHLRDTLAEIERVRGARADELRGEDRKSVV